MGNWRTEELASYAGIRGCSWAFLWRESRLPKLWGDNWRFPTLSLSCIYARQILHSCCGGGSLIIQGFTECLLCTMYWAGHIKTTKVLKEVNSLVEKADTFANNSREWKEEWRKYWVWAKSFFKFLKKHKAQVVPLSGIWFSGCWADGHWYSLLQKSRWPQFLTSLKTWRTVTGRKSILSLVI